MFRLLCCCCSCCKTRERNYPPIPGFTNRGAGAGPGEGEQERGSYRLRVIKALVQRYIETARREFEETRRKDLGTRLTELTKTVSRLQGEVAGVRRSVAEGRAPQPPDGASVLSRYITRVRNSFQNLGPPIPETPELTMPGLMGAQEPQSAGAAEESAPGEPGPSSPAHVLIHQEQDPEGSQELDPEGKAGPPEEP